MRRGSAPRSASAGSSSQAGPAPAKPRSAELAGDARRELRRPHPRVDAGRPSAAARADPARARAGCCDEPSRSDGLGAWGGGWGEGSASVPAPQEECPTAADRCMNRAMAGRRRPMTEMMRPIRRGAGRARQPGPRSGAGPVRCRRTGGRTSSSAWRRRSKEDDVRLPWPPGSRFFGLLALVPSLVALVSVYGLVADPSRRSENRRRRLRAAPQESARAGVLGELGAVVVEQLCPVGPAARGGRGSGASALWSASQRHGAPDGRPHAGVRRDRRPQVPAAAGPCTGPDDRRPSSVLVAGIGGMVAPDALDDSGAAGTARPCCGSLRWPVLALVGRGGTVAAATDGGRTATRARFRWVSPGAVLRHCRVGWPRSIGFSIYTCRLRGLQRDLRRARRHRGGHAVAVHHGVRGDPRRRAELRARANRRSSTRPRARRSPLGERRAYAATRFGRSTA